MSIIKRIEKIKRLLKELQNHPCCFSYSWDSLKRLTVVFPQGYYYGLAQGIRFNEESKSKCLEQAIDKLDEVWKLNY